MKQIGNVFKLIQFLCLMTTALVLLTACSQPHLKTISPHRGDIQQSFTELAKTTLTHTYTIHLPLSGDLQPITVEPGDKVKSGDIIAQLDLPPLQHAFDSGKATVDHFTALYNQEKKELNRLERLYEQRFVSPSEIDKSRFKVKALLSQLESNKALLANTAYQLNQATIRSPINGLVLKRFTDGHTWLPEGSKLLQLGNLNDLEAKAEVLTHQAQQLNIDDPVILTTLDNRLTINGHVKRIDPTGFTKQSSLGVDEQRVYVTIHLDNLTELKESHELGTEFQLQAQFFVGKTNQSALIIPRSSVLQDSENRYYVVKIVNKKPKKQIIQIDVVTDQDISITSGLSDKDVILAEPTAESLS